MSNFNPANTLYGLRAEYWLAMDMEDVYIASSSSHRKANIPCVEESDENEENEEMPSWNASCYVILDDMKNIQIIGPSNAAIEAWKHLKEIYEQRVLGKPEDALFHMIFFQQMDDIYRKLWMELSDEDFHMNCLPNIKAEDFVPLLEAYFDRNLTVTPEDKSELVHFISSTYNASQK